MKLVSSVKRFFGLTEGQTLSQFAEEYKQLSEKDRHELADMLTELGDNIEDYGTEAKSE